MPGLGDILVDWIEDEGRLVDVAKDLSIRGLKLELSELVRFRKGAELPGC